MQLGKVTDNLSYPYVCEATIIQNHWSKVTKVDWAGGKNEEKENGQLLFFLPVAPRRTRETLLGREDNLSSLQDTLNHQLP